METFDGYKAEILLRGEALHYSASIDASLNTIIVICNGDNPNDTGYQLKSSTEQRIIEAKKRLLAKDSFMGDKYSTLLDELNNLNFRHQMAHALISWKNKDEIQVYEINEKSKIASYNTKVYSANDMNQEMSRLRTIESSLREMLLEFMIRHTKQ